jgi:hypothetical protein
MVISIIYGYYGIPKGNVSIVAQYYTMTPTNVSTIPMSKNTSTTQFEPSLPNGITRKLKHVMFVQCENLNGVSGVLDSETDISGDIDCYVQKCYITVDSNGALRIEKASPQYVRYLNVSDL